MGINEEMVLARRDWIGASDVAVLLGVNLNRDGKPYKTVGDLYLEKTAQVPVEAIRDNDAMALGRHNEPWLRTWTERKLGVEIEPDVFLEHPHLRLKVNLDGRIKVEREHWECKCTGMLSHPHEVGQWGDSGTGDVPFSVAAQVQTQLMCMPDNIEFAHVTALIGGHGIRQYVVYRRPAIAEVIAQEIQRFWWDHVDKRIPPEEPATWEYLRLIEREQGKRVQVPVSLVAQWQLAAVERLAAEKAEKEAKELVASAMGDSELGECGIGTVRWTTRKMPEITLPARIDKFPIFQFSDPECRKRDGGEAKRAVLEGILTQGAEEDEPAV